MHKNSSEMDKLSGDGKKKIETKDTAVDMKMPAPTGLYAWVGFGCCVMALACLSVSFCSPYWLQTWPLSQNKFKSMGLWQVCFQNYMQFKDDSQEIYDGCWFVFDGQTKYYKLREWLIPPWFISCQVLTLGCLLIEIATSLVVAFIFLHFCPAINHEYLQTYGMFASASMMFLVTMISFVVAITFAIQTNDRYWLPRPDQNFLSWGYGFLIISALFTMTSGVFLFMESQKTYDALLRKEDDDMKAAVEMSALIPLEQADFPIIYEEEEEEEEQTQDRDWSGPYASGSTSQRLNDEGQRLRNGSGAHDESQRLRNGSGARRHGSEVDQRQMEWPDSGRSGISVPSTETSYGKKSGSTSSYA